MNHKKINSGKENDNDRLRVQLIAIKFNENEANQTKKYAQKILSIMFAALYKRGRPKKEKEEISYAV